MTTDTTHAAYDQGAQEMRPRSQVPARELMREIGSVLRMSEAEAAALPEIPEDAEEEQELLEILASDPTDTNAHLDLLRLYYARGDADKFEAAAGALSPSRL